MNSLLITLGLTRDSLLLAWSKWVSICVLVMTGLLPLDTYFTPKTIWWIRAIAFVTTIFAGHYDSSPLPGKKQN